jgi:hypothetical protein
MSLTDKPFKNSLKSILPSIGGKRTGNVSQCNCVFSLSTNTWSVIIGIKTSQKHRIKTSTHNAAQTFAYQEIPTTDFLHPIPAIF